MQGAMYGGAGAGGQMGMPQQMPQPRFTPQEPTQARGGNLFRSNQVTSVGGEESRGVLTGDACCTLSLDPSRARIDIATWNEHKSRCMQLESQSAILQVTEQGAKNIAALAASAPYAKHPLSELPEGVEICGPGGFTACEKQSESLVRPLDGLGRGNENMQLCGFKFSSAPLLAHLMVRCMDAGLAVERKGDGSEKAKNTKRSATAKTTSSTGNNTVTLVLPVSYTYSQYYSALKVLEGAGYTLRNVFNRGLATVAMHVIESRARLNLDDATTEKSEQDLLVLYVAIDKETKTVESALICCECNKSMKPKQARVVDRLYCASASTADEISTAQIDNMLRELLAGAGVSSSAKLHAAILVGGDEGDIKSLAGLADVPIMLRADPGDAVKGGCYLSAAELDSSKQYINNDGKWTAAYQLPIADGFLAFDIGMSVQLQEKDDAPVVETIFGSGTRIQKREIGIVRPCTKLEPEVVRTPLNIFSAHVHTPARLYPKLTF